MNIELKNYPEFIQERTNEFIDSLNMTGAFTVIESTPEFVSNAIAHTIFEKWTKDGDIEISEDQFHEAINLAEVNYALGGLIEKGLVSTFDDETYFLTESGKEIEKKIKNGKGNN